MTVYVVAYCFDVSFINYKKLKFPFSLTLQRGVTSTARHSVNITCRGVTGTARMLHALTHSSISRQVKEQM